MKILFIDIETSPSLGYVCGKWDQNVIEFKQEWYILSFAYQWNDEKKIHVKGLIDYPKYKKDKENDFELVSELHTLLTDADIVIAQNGDAFDVKKINARLLYHGFTPPKPYKTVDTLKILRAKFGFTSNKLDDVCAALGLGRKVKHTGFSLWKGCMEGDEKAWQKMKTYNKHDIVLLKLLYERIKGWTTNHPNVNLVSREMLACPKCGSHDLNKRGHQFSVGQKTQRLQCKACGGWCTGEKEAMEYKLVVR